MVHNCTCSICIIGIAMANSTKIIKTYMPSARLVLPSTAFVSLQSLLPKIPSCTSYLPTVLCPCMLVETNGEEGRRCKAKTKEGLGHRSRKDHSSCSSGVSGWDVWYPFFFVEQSKLHNMCPELKRASLVGMMLYVYLLAPQDPFSIYRYYCTKARSSSQLSSGKGGLHPGQVCQFIAGPH